MIFGARSTESVKQKLLIHKLETLSPRRTSRFRRVRSRLFREKGRLSLLSEVNVMPE